MITIEFTDGQGLGNQLWLYAVARVIAEDKGFSFGVKSPEKFKGSDFLDIYLGEQAWKVKYHYKEKGIIHPLNGADLRSHDDHLMEIPDNAELDGYFQDERYIAHKKEDIQKWFKVKQEYDCRDYSDDDICIINFRGSSYVNESGLLLQPRYWRNAMDNMRKVNLKMRFIVITEDPATAKTFFPDLEIHHFNIGKDYSIVKNARYLILSNSSFAWFPAWLSKDLKYCIAPKYWARHNISDGFWCLSYNITTGLMYQDRKGVLHDYDSCKKELEAYIANNRLLYSGTVPYNPSFITSMRENMRIFNTLRRESSSASAIIDMTFMKMRHAIIRLRKLLNGDMLK